MRAMPFGTDSDLGMTVAVIGGGMAGGLFAVKLAALKPDWQVTLIEMAGEPGRGLAYGACAPFHLLNVPVQRLEVGLTPGFRDWLIARGEDLAPALDESGGDLAGAFVPRTLFGAYMAERVAGSGIRIVRGEAVELLEGPQRGVLLRDGRAISADLIVLATGNFPPKAPLPAASPVQDAAAFIVDPWSPEALAGLDPEAPVVLIGTGLTMVDIALKLAESGHRGPMHAVSRHGLLPQDHRFGGEWAPFVTPLLPAGPARLMRAIREAAAEAARRGVPWQRVVDAVRPAIGRIWDGWTATQRRIFARHGRAYWDVHRHRLAPRIARRLAALVESGALAIEAGRIAACRAESGAILVDIKQRETGEIRTLEARRLINCTGPRSDLATVGIPLFADLRRRGLIRPDAMALGLETEDCAVLDRDGQASSWLYALGPLTRPAWWEITAVPEIAAQIDQLVETLTGAGSDRIRPPLADAFLDLGAGI
jgi:uncharacterized NAD(P)/FAD-binding protein YdhS